MAPDNTNEQQELSYGQQAVGLTFNPSGDERVTRAKQLCADLIDLVWDTATPNDSRFLNGLRTFAVNTILSGQMLAVKVLTWKD